MPVQNITTALGLSVGLREECQRNFQKIMVKTYLTWNLSNIKQVLHCSYIKMCVHANTKVLFATTCQNIGRRLTHHILVLRTGSEIKREHNF